MPKGMLGDNELLRHVLSGQVTDLLVKFNGEDGDVWRAQHAKFLRKEPTWLNSTAIPTPDKSKLFEAVAMLTVPTTPRFVAADHFRVDTSKKAKVKIAFLWNNFEKNFVPKVEVDIPAGELKIYKLLRDSVDTPIIAELGERHETYLADIWAMLSKQPNGEKGDLLVNGWANIFYVRDTQGALWAVNAYWRADCGGWGLHAGSVSHPSPWSADHRVGSR